MIRRTVPGARSPSPPAFLPPPFGLNVQHPAGDGQLDILLGIDAGQVSMDHQRPVLPVFLDRDQVPGLPPVREPLDRNGIIRTHSSNIRSNLLKTSVASPRGSLAAHDRRGPPAAAPAGPSRPAGAAWPGPGPAAGYPSLSQTVSTDSSSTGSSGSTSPVHSTLAGNASAAATSAGATGLTHGCSSLRVQADRYRLAAVTIGTSHRAVSGALAIRAGSRRPRRCIRAPAGPSCNRCPAGLAPARPRLPAGRSGGRGGSRRTPGAAEG
jgi:hypothetical protein